MTEPTPVVDSLPKVVTTLLVRAIHAGGDPLPPEVAQRIWENRWADRLFLCESCDQPCIADDRSTYHLTNFSPKCGPKPIWVGIYLRFQATDEMHAMEQFVNVVGSGDVRELINVVENEHLMSWRLRCGHMAAVNSATGQAWCDVCGSYQIGAFPLPKGVAT